MFAALASLLLAANVATAPAPSAVSDVDVPRYLRGAEIAEWSRARILHDQGQARLTQGNSIVNTPRTPLKGAGFETPEQAKARGEAMIRDGEAQLQRANEILARLRRTAAGRFADLTKSVSETVEIAGYSWSEGLLVTIFRAQKVARDAGMTSHHVLGAWTYGADGRPVRNAELLEDLRAAWAKTQGERAYLQPVPASGYKVLPQPGPEAPAVLAEGWVAPTAANQTALVWAEVYPATPGVSMVFVRVADAWTLRLVASECFLTLGRDSAGGARASVTLRDERSFLPRLGASGAWRIGYPREFCHPLGAALLRHLCARGNRVAVPAGAWLGELLGGQAQLDDRMNAIWKIRQVPGTTGDFKITSQPLGSSFETPPAPVEVGLMTLRVEADKAAPKAPEKPADKPAERPAPDKAAPKPAGK